MTNKTQWPGFDAPREQVVTAKIACLREEAERAETVANILKEGPFAKEFHEGISDLLLFSAFLESAALLAENPGDEASLDLVGMNLLGALNTVYEHLETQNQEITKK